MPPAVRRERIISFDLAVFAAAPDADEATARALMERCRDYYNHVDGDLDKRVVAFYEKLRAIYPDHPPYDPRPVWASMPLATGIDHVFMCISWSAATDVIEVVERLAAEHGLVLHDPQDDTIYLPESERH